MNIFLKNYRMENKIIIVGAGQVGASHIKSISTHQQKEQILIAVESQKLELSKEENIGFLIKKLDRFEYEFDPSSIRYKKSKYKRRINKYK